MKKLVIILISVVVLAFILGFVLQGPPVKAENIKIGFIGPLTGEAASYGLSLKNTVQLAVDEINSDGGINNRKLEIIYEDGKCNQEDSAAAMRKLADIDKVEVVIGGSCSDESLGAIPIAEQNKVFLFSPSSSSPNLTNISPFFARSYPSDVGQGSSLAEIAFHDEGWEKISVIQENLSYPLGLYNSFLSVFIEHGGIVVKEEFNYEETDFTDSLMKLQNENSDALFIVTQTPVSGQAIIKNLQEMNWKPKLMVGDVILGDTELVAKNADFLRRSNRSRIYF